ncbi:PREDICTED: uncharacterized protein LOC104589233 isoform X1 [Nelumbo nucifera]|uniref:Uncharacterized protein LOC104589233 isoform X1 n=1 Tax=Nelumbo nucifera TaxID=4432 RepID=A0A1U8PZ94_NELNU|nr:PREDICTED: uncharacterized protein LOC104589233 isoform X1 [Nelumbo nucifera]XP_019051846.1 PREDICTED: uncharacterized protein LOC104589233 isoform X1 [Nelumbo nucifera]XP_019051847.1 PREDICTED: uncharacterized protein LOC104589233 isoform X1 [Nelumbo nucifera]XP_019051848.1 PREDICTED: uncharacterized protein LOC104589233 isoform X1 [Nelumbo nucifera]
MKQPYIMLCLLIPGPCEPGNDIDVYLQPLIEDLTDLWENGVLTYDASRKKMFLLHAAILWTIIDFPGYANLSGWSTKGALACPSCNKDTCSLWLNNGHKYCYMGHCRFLDEGHRFRSDETSFDGNEEWRLAPIPLTGKNALEQFEGLHFTLGKGIQSNVEGGHHGTDKKNFYNWKKRSIFFDLPYWKDLLVKHNLDMMHIEKNDLKACHDLQAMGIRKALHPFCDSQSDRTFLPAACYTLNRKEKTTFCQVLQSVKVPDGYASNISRLVQVNNRKLAGLKSHDFHVLMQQLLPIAIRRVLPKNVSSVLIDLCKFFRDLCSTVSKGQDFVSLDRNIAIILCQLERIFPLAFFDIMVHLPIHLTEEARLAGPV